MAYGNAHFEGEQQGAPVPEPAPSLSAERVQAADAASDSDGKTACAARHNHSAGESIRVLLIEDQELISLDLCDILVGAGYEVIGPATTLAGALFMLRQQPVPQLAIVDVLLRDGPCTEIAQQLRRRGVPFFIHSGYGRHASLIEGFEEAPNLAKPASPQAIVKLLRQLAA